jgi:hypothetical protein
MLAACLHVLAFSAILTQVVNATPQPLGVGSQDPTIDYYPPGAWGYANATDGYSKVGGAGVLMFVFDNASDAEVSWRTPSKSLNLCPPLAVFVDLWGSRLFQMQRKYCSRRGRRSNFNLSASNTPGRLSNIGEGEFWACRERNLC